MRYATVTRVLPGLRYTVRIDGIVQAAEKKIARAELPPAVETTVAAESRGATIIGLSTEVEGGAHSRAR